MTIKFKSIVKQDIKLAVLASMYMEGSSLLVERAQALKSDKHL